MARHLQMYNWLSVRDFGNDQTSSDVQLQGSKIALVCSYLRVPQAAGQVKILIFLVRIKFFPIHANHFCDTGRVLILRYFEA